MTRINLAALGTDGTLGGPGGSPLSSSTFATGTDALGAHRLLARLHCRPPLSVRSIRSWTLRGMCRVTRSV